MNTRKLTMLILLWYRMRGKVKKRASMESLLNPAVVNKAGVQTVAIVLKVTVFEITSFMIVPSKYCSSARPSAFTPAHEGDIKR